MAKKVGLIVVEFDDEEDNFRTTTDLAFYVDLNLHELKNLDVTVYSTPQDLMKDIAELQGPFADVAGRPETIPHEDEPIPEYVATIRA